MKRSLFIEYNVEIVNQISNISMIRCGTNDTDFFPAVTLVYIIFRDTICLPFDVLGRFVMATHYFGGILRS